MFGSGRVAVAVGSVLLFTLVPSASARQVTDLDPLGEYTIELNVGGTAVEAVLAVVGGKDGASPMAHLTLPGEPSLVLGTVHVDEWTMTLRDHVGAAEVLFELRFESDSAFTGAWAIGSVDGVAAGRRGVDPTMMAQPPRCADAPGDLPTPMHTPRPGPDPDAARIVTTDVALFWEVVDSGPNETLAQRLHCDYLRRGTDAVRDFIPVRIVSGERLAETVTDQRERYESTRWSGLTVAELEPEIRTVFRELKARYPDAVFPDVYFVVGRLNTGGMISQRGLLIGAEMYPDRSAMLPIVAHELIHFQQRPIPADQRTLLAQAIMEGSADFVAELITGNHINHEAHAYGLPRERELWEEFRQVMHGSDFAGWLYGGSPEGRPADLGYFIGYRIAQAYHANAGADEQAVREILEVTDYMDFLERSGYEP